MTITSRVATWLGGPQASAKPTFADLAQKISLESKLARVAECLERELHGRTHAGQPLANTTGTGL